MTLPLAYFITWHTYGSRLHGDAKGTVDYHHRDVNTPVLQADPKRESESHSRMQASEVELDSAMRRAVVEQVLETCRHRDWQLHAVHARITHIHAVVTAYARPEKVLADLKAYTTRRLRKATRIDADQPVWSEHGSTRYLWKPDSVSEKIHYTLHEQGTPMARWPDPPASPEHDIQTEHDA